VAIEFVGQQTKLSCHRKDEGLEDSIAYRRIRLPAAPAEAWELGPEPLLAAQLAGNKEGLVRHRCDGSFEMNEVRSATLQRLLPQGVVELRFARLGCRLGQDSTRQAIACGY
jgi:hypothetical protein